MGIRCVLRAFICVMFTSSLVQVLYVLQNPFDRFPLRKEQRLTTEGRQQRQVFLWTQVRSGSTFIGRVLAAGKGTFYSEEPIRINKRNFSNRNGSDAITFLKEICHCRFPRQPEVFERLISMQIQDMEMKILCEVDQELCSSPTTYETFCSVAKVGLVRVVALALPASLPLLEDDALDARLIHLVRDPRASIASKRRISSVIHEEELNTSLVCQRYRKDLVAATQLQRQYPDR